LAIIKLHRLPTDQNMHTDLQNKPQNKPHTNLVAKLENELNSLSKSEKKVGVIVLEAP